MSAEGLTPAGVGADVDLTDRRSCAAATSTDFDQLIKDSHDEAFNEVGLDVGTPVLRITGKALFGPVITPAPRGEAAGRLWDGLVMIASAQLAVVVVAGAQHCRAALGPGHESPTLTCGA